MHCNLRPPVPLVTLCFNHETGNAWTYQILAKSDNYAAELQRFNHFQFGAVHHIGFDWKLIFTIPQLPETYIAPTWDNARMSYWWFITFSPLCGGFVDAIRGTGVGELAYTEFELDYQAHRPIIDVPK